jgi:hypothetical protein
MAYASITSAASGDNTVVAAVAGKKIQVERFVISSSGTVNAKWRSGTTDISGLLYMVANSGVTCPGSGSEYWLETAAGQALVLNLSAAIAVGGLVVYELG